MTRIALVLVLLASAAFGQTYVRPSKGAAINPFPTKPLNWSAYPVINGGTGLSNSIAAAGPAWDWSAFEAMRIRVVGSGNGLNYLGTEFCSNLYLTYNVSNIGPYARVYLKKAQMDASYVFLAIQDSTTPSASDFVEMQTVNARVDLSQFTGCTISITVTPIPFAPPTVYSATTDGGYSVNVNATLSVPDSGINVNIVSGGTSTATTPSDGGYTTGASVVLTQPYQCGSWLENVFTMDGGSVSVLSSSNARVYANICNSAENTSGFIRCRSDGFAASTTTGSIGTVLDVGDCLLSTNPASAPVYCAGASGLYLTVAECGPSPVAAVSSVSADSGVLAYLAMETTMANPSIGATGLVNSVDGGPVGSVSAFTQTLVAGKIGNGTSYASGALIPGVTNMYQFYPPYNGSSPLPTAWTVAGWVKQNTYIAQWFGNDSAIFSEGSQFEGFFSGASGWYVLGANGTVATTPTGTAIIPLSTWNHFAVTYDGTYARVYVNGAYVTGAAISFTSGFSFNNIGNINNYYTLNGYLDEMVVYSRAINASEVSYLYNSGAGRTWPL